MDNMQAKLLEAATQGFTESLHLCVKSYQLQTLRQLTKALHSRDDPAALAEANKQVEVEVEKLLVGAGARAVEANALNNEMMPALIDAVLTGSKRDAGSEDSVKDGGGECESSSNNTKSRGKYDEKKDDMELEGILKQHDAWLEKTKTSLMVVAFLIATMAFQIGVKPLKDDKATDSEGQAAGSAHECSNVWYERFYISNKYSTGLIIFIVSLIIILLLVIIGLRYWILWIFMIGLKCLMWILMIQTWIGITAITFCYVFVNAALTPGHKHSSVVYVIGFTVILWAFFLIAHTIRLVVKLVTRLRKLSWRRPPKMKQ